MTSDDDDAQVLAKMAALDAEVKADVARQRARKEKAIELLAAKKAAIAAKTGAADLLVAPVATTSATVHVSSEASTASKAVTSPVRAPASVASVAEAPQKRPVAITKPVVASKPAINSTSNSTSNVTSDPSDDELQLLLDEVAPPVANKSKSKANPPSADQKAIVKGKPATPAVPKKPKHKSWKTSGLVSTALGPIGWLYAGAWRESVPAAVVFLALGYLLQFLPTIILWPALLIGLPISGVTGALYASRYNKSGGRQRLFGSSDSQKKLIAGKK